MYRPEQFIENDTKILHGLMRQYSFATVVTQRDGEMCANHFPLLLDETRGRHGTLIGHMAKNNSQWRDFQTDSEVLVIFQGPHGYISPSWYEREPVVPTWNYAVVHVYGKGRIIEEAGALLAVLEKSVQHYESHYENPWPFQLAEERREKVLSAIVGFEIDIERLEGKFKLSQNRVVTERQNISDALRESSSPRDVALGKLMSDMPKKGGANNERE